jgi:hypothetical protein
MVAMNFALIQPLASAVSMNFTLIQLLASLGALVVFVAKCAGVIVVRRSAAKLPWWLMVAGVVVSTLASILPRFGLVFNASPFASFAPTALLWLAPQLGSMMFFIGFAMYAMQAARAANRSSDLEQLTAAMSEEIDRLREGSSRP